MRFKDIDVLKCLVCETAEPLAPKRVTELVCTKAKIAPFGHGSFLHPKLRNYSQLSVIIHPHEDESPIRRWILLT